MNLKHSVCFPMLGLADPAALFPRFAELGFDAVEFWHRDDLPDFPAVLAAARRHGLAIASMCGHRSLTDGMNRPENHPRIEAELRESISIAAQHGIRGLVCFSGNRIASQSDEAGLEHCVRLLRRIAPVAERHGVLLNVELLNSRLDHRGYQADHTDWGAAVCERVDNSHVRLLYDIYHMQIMEGDLIRTIRRHIRWIGHFHTAGNPGRHELDDTQEINYRAVLPAIAATGYAGFIGHEFRPSGDPLSALAHARTLGRPAP